MPRDYKYRAAANNRYSRPYPRQRSGGIWRWLLITVLVVAFIFLLQLLVVKIPALIFGQHADPATQQLEDKIKQVIPLEQAAKQPEPTVVKTEPPAPPAEVTRYDFYTILPQAETVVPDHEIKTRVREEFVGKSKLAKYNMQVGSFQKNEEAEALKLKLAKLGIESQIESAKVGATSWRRVKIGPYNNPSIVANITELLQKNNISVLVTESD